MIDSVLFAIRTTRHSSMGMSPYRVIFNKDPLLPFEFVDKQKTRANVTDRDSKSDESGNSEMCAENEVGSSSGMDQLMAMVQKLEDQGNKVFQNAHTNIKKAQAQQTKLYNNRNCYGKPFEIGDLMLKKRLYQTKWGKLRRPFNGPYTIIGKCSTGFYLCDRYSHVLSRAVVPGHLVRFFKKSKMATTVSPNSSDSSRCNSDLSDVENVTSCTWVKTYESQSKSSIVTSALIKL